MSARSKLRVQALTPVVPTAPRIRATSREVAEVARVSQATVSRAFAGGKVSAAVKARVLAAAEQLNYRPNAVARSLTQGRSHLIALIVSDQTSLIYPELVYALTERLADRGYRVLLFTTGAVRSEAQILDEIWSHRVDGVISMTPLSDDRAARFVRNRLPIVLYNQVAGRDISSVYCDHFQAGQQLAGQMLRSRLLDVAVLAGPPQSFVSCQFIAGFGAGIDGSGARLTVVQGPYRYEFGKAGFVAAASLATRPLKAVVCVNDTVAAGCLDHLRLDLRLKVPGDVAVVALNGRGPSLWGAYAITAMRQPTDSMAEAAVETLLASVEDCARPAEHRVFFTTFFTGTTARLETG